MRQRRTGQACFAIRNSLDLSGANDKPASLSLQHAAGGDTFGIADIAVMGDLSCLTRSDREIRVGYGLDYHLNTSDASRSESATSGLSFSIGWGEGAEPSQSPSGDLGHWHRISMNAEYGRDLEQDRSLARASIFYDATPIGARRPAEVAGDPIANYGVLGGNFRRYMGGGKRSPALFHYQFRPGIEHFHGYQPSATTGTLDATYVALAADMQWHPNVASERLPVYLRVDAIARTKIGGDDAMPSTANQLSAALGLRLAPASSGPVARKAAIELSYSIGRSPDEGFVREEMLMLKFTYLLDRADARLR
jgi:hypothetical protein